MHLLKIGINEILIWLGFILAADIVARILDLRESKGRR